MLITTTTKKGAPAKVNTFPFDENRCEKVQRVASTQLVLMYLHEIIGLGSHPALPNIIYLFFN